MLGKNLRGALFWKIPELWRIVRIMARFILLFLLSIVGGGIPVGLLLITRIIGVR